MYESAGVSCFDGGWRRGKKTNLKEIANEAMRRSPTIEVCITVRRTGEDVYMENDRDFWYHDLLSLPIASHKCETEPMDAEDMLFILYTSGTTGRPKGIVHTHGGYSVYTATTHKYVFDIKEESKPANDMVDGNRLQLHLFIGWGDAHKFTFVCASNCAAYRCLVPFDDHVIQGVMKVGKCV